MLTIYQCVFIYSMKYDNGQQMNEKQMKIVVEARNETCSANSENLF